jgi:hypothetical protein
MHGGFMSRDHNMNQNDPNLLQHISRYWVEIQIVLPYLDFSVVVNCKQAKHYFWRRKPKHLSMYHTGQIYNAQNFAIYLFNIHSLIL